MWFNHSINFLKRTLTPALVVAVAVAGSAGCSGLAEGDGASPYDPVYDPDAMPPSPGQLAMPTSSCTDPSGFDGRGCFRCTPSSSDELLAACTTSRFETFDNAARIRGFATSNPRPTLPAQGATPPPLDAPTDPTDGGTAPPAPPCAVGAASNPLMVLGATGFPMATVAKAMGSSGTLFYRETGSCDGVAAMVLDQKLHGEVVTYDTDGTASRCTLTEDHPADLALSALFAASCANASGLAEPVSLPSNVDDLLGPINPVMFAVPATSKERSISAEAAYEVFGAGSLSGVAPWTNEVYVFRRRPGSGNQLTVSLDLGLPVDAFRGRDANGSSNMLQALLTSAAPSQTIGISSSEIVDTNRDVMKTLAYQHYGQPAAFYPDSDPASLDRRNVRDGHYPLWLSLHVLVRSRSGDPVAATNPVLDPDGTKQGARDAAAKLLAYVMVSRQQAPVPSIDLFGALKRTGTVPQCAMRVTRTTEGAPLTSFTPPVSCDCAFEAATPGNTRADCIPCKDTTGCTSGSRCSFGFCEKSAP